MTKHIIQIIAITIVIVFCIFRPYLPGDYDGFAVSLSVMAQLFAFASLLFVPIGVMWLIFELADLKEKSLNQLNRSFPFAKISIAVAGIVAVITSLGAFVTNNRSAAVLALNIFGLIIIRYAIKLKELKNTTPRFNPAPLYLIIIPLMLILIRFMFIVPAIDFSRNYAIRQSERLIIDIEAYNTKNGHYPVSLQSVWEDYKPSITCIDRYHYELNGAAYNLYFEHFSNELGVREIVMYNKLDEHEMTSHDQDILQLSPGNILRGYHVVRELPNPHWKYFWFD